MMAPLTAGSMASSAHGPRWKLRRPPSNSIVFRWRTTVDSEHGVEGAVACDSRQQRNDADEPEPSKRVISLEQQTEQCQTEYDASQSIDATDVGFHDTSSEGWVPGAIAGFAEITWASRARAPRSELAIKQPYSARSRSSRALVVSVPAGTVSVAKVV
jgi:hypothetical protein